MLCKYHAGESVSDYQLNNALVTAVCEGDEEAARVALDGGASMACQEAGRPHDAPLALAAFRGHISCVRLLLARGADVNAVGSDGASALYSAVDGDKLDVATLLLESDANVEAADLDGDTPLSRAAFHGNEAFVRFFLERGAAVSGTSELRWPPLCRALTRGHLGVAQLLLDHGADLSAVGRADGPPLACALSYGHDAFAQLLVERGAAVNSADDERSTPLHICAERGHVDLARILLEAGAAVNAETIYGTTPLHSAVTQGHSGVARLLLQHHAAVDASTMEFDVDTPLMCAIKLGHDECVRVILEHGAAFGPLYEEGWTPLHESAHHGRLEAARFLIEHGADLDALANNGLYDCTPLHVAIERSQPQIARLLLEHHASLDGLDAPDAPTRSQLWQLAADADEPSGAFLFQLLWRGVHGELRVGDAESDTERLLMRGMLAAWQRGGLRCWTPDTHAFFPAAFRADASSMLLATLGSREDGRAAEDDAPSGDAARAMQGRRGAPASLARAAPNPLRALQNEHVLDALFQALLTLHMGGPPAAPLVAED